MFHHFHDELLHKQGQGSISKDEFNEKAVEEFYENKINSKLNSFEFDNKLLKDPFFLKE